nr:reverse transcriptase domain-containing protein [Tanacetum cinerariifolium]
MEKYNPLSYPLPYIPSPPLPVPSPPLPLPSSPTTSPTYAEAPLGCRAARIQLRAASPSTHHPLEIPSASLVLPFITHRDDLPEADMPLRKRARFIAPTGRFKVGKSLSAAAARPSGHTLAHRVDYGFVNNVDTSICASESRVMTAIGEVNNRVTYLATTQSQDAQELYVHCLKILYALQRQDLRMDQRMVVVAKMPPKRTTATTTPMTDAQFKALIAQGIADTLAECDADRSRNNDDSHDSGSNGRRQMSVSRECTYSGFLKGQPLNFKGTKGVIELTQWKFEDTSRNSQNQQQPFKRYNVAWAYTAGPGKRNRTEDLNLCALNETTIMIDSVLPSTPTTRGLAIYPETGHFKSNFPKLKNKNQGNQAGNGNAVARAYGVSTTGTNPNSNVIMEMGSFDVIIGMDWLSKYHAVIVYDEKIVRILFGNEILIVHGDGSNNEYGSRLNIISCTKTQKYLLKGCQVFLAHIITKKAEDKSEEK